MKKKIIVATGVILIVAVAIVGYSFAEEISFMRHMNGRGCNSAQEEMTKRNRDNQCENRKAIMQLMRDNGFEEMATWMEEGDFESMDEFMNNLSEEDYQKMIDLLRNNGFDNKAMMMESAGREGMINMHNSMMRGNGARSSKKCRFRE